MPYPKQRLCPGGHVYDEVGKTAKGACKACNRVYTRRKYRTEHPRRWLALPRLQELREFRGMSRSGLANAAGIAYCTIHRIETGQRTAHVDTANACATALNVSLIQLTEPLDGRRM